MDVLDLTPLPRRPSLDALSGELLFVPFVNHLMMTLVERAPVEITAELVPGEERLNWYVEDLSNSDGSGRKEVLCTIESRQFRSVLGAVGTRFIPEALYGGYRSCRLRQGNRVVEAVLFMGNDALHGLWFRGRSAPS